MSPNRRIGSRIAKAPADSGIAMLFVVMAVLILSTLSLVVLASIVVQAKPTQFQRKNNQTLNAAETGLNAAAAQIRNATYVQTGITYGDRTLLPCWTGQTGSVGDPGGASLTYTVTIQYFTADPTGQSASWRSANALTCVTGVGTVVTPAFAFITSAGSGPALPGQPASTGNRTLQSVYTVNQSNPNLPGGLIRDGAGLCYAGSTSAGGTVTLAACLAGADSQMWAFTANNLLVLTSTRALDGTGGLCISAAPASSAVTAVNAVMKACDSADQTQRWGVNGNNPIHFFGHLTSSYSVSWCLGAVAAGVPGSTLSANQNTCGTGSAGAYPEPAVGAGAAGSTARTVAEVDGVALQWVNYQDFGRCLDITSWNLNATYDILYPCKQDPMSASDARAQPGWNQVFTWTSSTKYFHVNASSSIGVPSDPANPRYCMRTPGTNGGYVSFSDSCASITAASNAQYTWTVNRDTGDRRTSYTVVDSFGRCLATTPRVGAYANAITADCDGSDGQKWNAPPVLGSAALGNTAEVRDH